MYASSQQFEWIEIAPGGWKHAGLPGPFFQFNDPVGFEWNTYRLRVDALPAALEGLRIVHISDTHCRPQWKRAYDDLNDRLAADVPDLILFTGDLVDDRMRPGRAVGIGKRLVAGWRARLGTFGIRGNHDLKLPMSRFIGSTLQYIEGQCITIDHNGASLELIGLPGPDHFDLPKNFAITMPPRRTGVPRIVLSHYPDHIRACRPLQSDLFLAGHTHGGQCDLPGLVPIIRHDSLLWRYTRGVHWFDSQWLVVSRGLGFSTYPIRVMCPAEVIEIILTQGDAVDGSAR